MSFKFNFNVESEERESNKDLDAAPVAAASSEQVDKEIKPFVEIDSDTGKKLDSYIEEAYPLEGCTIYCVSEKSVESCMVENSSDEIASAALKQDSDLVPNVYEGGLKIWECSRDLVEYFNEKEVDFEGKRVLELGCGAALPALYALKNGAKAVHFSDYNDAVLQNVTIPNVRLNCEEDESCSMEKCRFYAGDWSHLQQELSSRGDKYDIILTSETIYSSDSYEKLHDVMAATLEHSGVIYLAAKAYYFGVGGGIQSFEECIKNKGVFESEVCKRFDEGVPREILLLKRKASS